MRLLYENEPNPVAQIIVTRSLQVGLPASAIFALAFPHIAKNELWNLAFAGSAVVFTGLSASFLATFNPRFGWGYPILCTLPDIAVNRNTIAITFDDGPFPQTTPHLLRILHEHDAKATFFLVGERAKRSPHLVKQIADAGHTIGLHGYRHRTLALLNAKQIRDDLKYTRAVIESAVGRSIPLQFLRPPYGFTTHTLCRIARISGYEMAGWNLDPRDYDSVDGETIARRVIERLKPRSIVLLHERRGETASIEALPEILHRAKSSGFRCVSL